MVTEYAHGLYLLKDDSILNMANDDKKKDEGISIPTISSTLGSLSEVRAINDYAAGLSFAIPNESVLDRFTITLESQREALDSVLHLGEKYQIETARLNSVLENTIIPVSSAVAGIGLINANSTRLLGESLITTQQLETVRGFSNLALDAIQAQQSVVQSSILAIESSGVLRLAQDISPSLQVVSSGLTQMVRSFPTFPLDTVLLPSLETAHEDSELDDEQIAEHQERLDTLLNDVSPSLVEFRRGVWEAFNGKGRDYVGQASSSMRRLVDNLLRELAPQEKVVETEYFKNSPKAKDDKGRPTRRARILYLIKWDENKAEHLQRLTNGFLEAYDNLSAWDHAPLDKDGFVHGALITIEGYLISILTVQEE